MLKMGFIKKEPTMVEKRNKTKAKNEEHSKTNTINNSIDLLNLSSIL